MLFAALLGELVKYFGLQNHQGINYLLPKASLGSKFAQITVKKHKATVYVPDENLEKSLYRNSSRCSKVSEIWEILSFITTTKNKQRNPKRVSEILCYIVVAMMNLS